MSVDQIAATWWVGARRGSAVARRRVCELSREGLLSVFTLLTQQTPKLDEPVAAWKPKELPPDFGAVAFALSSRWCGPSRVTACVAATAEAGNWLGGHGGRRPRTSEASHDIQLAAVFLRFRSLEPKRAERWDSEPALAERGEGRGDRLPDAMVVARGEKTVIECGGAYGRKKLEEFHRYCERRGFGYELW